MKIIEIYDKEHPVYNIMAQVLYPDADIVYLGVKSLLSERNQLRLRNFFTARESRTEPTFITVPDDTVNSVKDAVLPLIKEGDSFIELRGGTEGMLVSIGIIADQYNLSIFQINENTGKVKLIKGALPGPMPQKPNLKFKELICLTGGCIGSATEDLSVQIDDNAKAVVNNLWNRYRINPGKYNAKNGSLVRIINSRITKDCYPVIRIPEEKAVKIPENDFNWIIGYISLLEQERIVKVIQKNRKGIVYEYKSGICRELLEKSGLLLELFSRIAALETGRFSDVRQGVKIDWDGTVNDNGTVYGTNNEVDLILVDTFTVYFVSCKSGPFDKSALYELDTVAHRFNTGIIRKFIVCDKADDATRERAHDMQIQLIDDITRMKSSEDLIKRFRKIM